MGQDNPNAIDLLNTHTQNSYHGRVVGAHHPREARSHCITHFTVYNPEDKLWYRTHTHKQPCSTQLGRNAHQRTASLPATQQCLGTIAPVSYQPRHLALTLQVECWGRSVNTPH